MRSLALLAYFNDTVTEQYLKCRVNQATTFRIAATETLHLTVARNLGEVEVEEVEEVEGAEGAEGVEIHATT